MAERNRTSGGDCNLFGWSVKVIIALYNRRSIFAESYAGVNCSYITRTYLCPPAVFKHSQTRPIKLLKQSSSRSSRNQKVDL